jgi:hypothetical protein
MTFLGFLLRLGILYLLVRLIWRAFARPPVRRPPPADPADKPLGDDIVDAEWTDLDE